MRANPTRRKGRKSPPVALGVFGGAIPCWIPVQPHLPPKFAEFGRIGGVSFPPRPSILSDFPIFRWNYLSGELWRCHSSRGISAPSADGGAPISPVPHSPESGGFGGISWKNAFPVALYGAESGGAERRHVGFGAEISLSGREEGRISLMQRAQVIVKQPPMPPAKKAAGDSSIGFGRRGHGGKSHAVQGAGQGGVE